MPTKEEWTQREKETLKEARWWASIHPWTVTQNGQLYQVHDSKHRRLYQNRSIWKVNNWIQDHAPWAKPIKDKPGQPTSKIERHYKNLHVPKHESDNNDYSLTEKEKQDIFNDSLARIKAAAETLEEIVAYPYAIYCCTEPGAIAFALTDQDGDVLKESDSPWAIANHYFRITPKSIVSGTN